MVWKGFKDIQATIITDLTKSKEELKKNLKKDARRYLKKAYRYQLEFEESNEWDKFYSVYKKVAITGGIIPIPLNKLKEEHNLYLLIAKYKEKIIGGVVINFKKGIPTMMINAINDNFYYTRAGYFVYWNMILWAKNKGYKRLDLGGYQLKAKGKLEYINKFKEKWGGKIIHYYVYSKNPFYILGRKIIRNIPLIKKVKDKIKLVKYLVEMRIKKYGLSIFLKKCFKKFIYDRTEMILFSSTSEDIKKLRQKINVVFRKADVGDLKKLVKMKYFIFDELLEERLDSGDECFIFLYDSKVVHYSWVTYREMNISEVGIKLPLNQNEFCIFDCYTTKESRGLNLYPSMLCEIKSYLHNKGFVKCFIYSDIKNEASIRGIEKAGFIKIKNLKYLNILGFKKKLIGDLLS